MLRFGFTLGIVRLVFGRNAVTSVNLV